MSDKITRLLAELEEEKLNYIYEKEERKPVRKVMFEVEQVSHLSELLNKHKEFFELNFIESYEQQGMFHFVFELKDKYKDEIA